MTIVSITLTRNDGDLIEAFVRHHLDVVDRMIIYVHRCSDNTQEILSNLLSEGLPLDLRQYDATDGETKGARQITGDVGLNRVAALFGKAMKETLERYDPDFILPIDSDEFLTGMGAPRETIMALPRDAPTGLAWRTYIPTPSDLVGEPNLLRRVQHRRSMDDARFTKTIVPRAVARRGDAILAPGNHRVMDAETGAFFPQVTSEALWLAHFPVRSERQLRVKILSGYLTLIASPVRGPLDGYHWRRLFPRCKDPLAMTAEEVSDIALRYGWVEDELPLPSLVKAPVTTSVKDLRYPVRSADPFTILAENADHLANEVHRLAKDRLALEEKVRASLRK